MSSDLFGYLDCLYIYIYQFIIGSFKTLITDANSLKYLQIIFNCQENKLYILYVCQCLYGVINFDDDIISEFLTSSKLNEFSMI